MLIFVRGRQGANILIFFSFDPGSFWKRVPLIPYALAFCSDLSLSSVLFEVYGVWYVFIFGETKVFFPLCCVERSTLFCNVDIFFSLVRVLCVWLVLRCLILSLHHRRQTPLHPPTAWAQTTRSFPWKRGPARNIRSPIAVSFFFFCLAALILAIVSAGNWRKSLQNGIYVSDESHLPPIR